MNKMAEESRDKPLEILVIDDDILITSLLAESLTAIGTKASQANCGNDGVSMYTSRLGTKNEYDAVLTDLSMHNGDGVFVTKEIKTLNPKTQVIVVTGYEPTNEYAKLSQSLEQQRPDGIVGKPLGFLDIGHMVKQIKDVRSIRETKPDYQPEPLSYMLPKLAQS